MSMMQIARTSALLLLISTSACSGGEAETSGNAIATGGEDALAGSAELAQDAALANEAAADEAADIEAFGGNAAAMEENRR